MRLCTADLLWPGSAMLFYVSCWHCRVQRLASLPPLSCHGGGSLGTQDTSRDTQPQLKVCRLFVLPLMCP